MTDEELAAIEARANAATPGRWINDGFDVWSEAGNVASTSPVEIDARRPLDDARFIAYAREDVPALIAEVKRLREALGGILRRDDPKCSHDPNVCRWCFARWVAKGETLAAPPRPDDDGGEDRD